MQCFETKQVECPCAPCRKDERRKRFFIITPFPPQYCPSVPLYKSLQTHQYSTDAPLCFRYASDMVPIYFRCIYRIHIGTISEAYRKHIGITWEHKRSIGEETNFEKWFRGEEGRGFGVLKAVLGSNLDISKKLRIFAFCAIYIWLILLFDIQLIEICV